MLIRLVASVLILTVTTAAQSSDTQCYRRTNNDTQPQISYWFACNDTAILSGGPEVCCLDGYECGEGSICRTTDGDQTRWMVGGCTDPDYKDPVCRQDCSEQRLAGDKMTFITYEDGKWNCCGSDGCDNGKLTGETFKALSPAQWTPVADDTGPITSIPSSHSSNSSGGLSTGAKAGIAVGVGVVGLALIGGGLFWWRIKKNKSRTNYAGVKGKYEELGRIGRASSPAPYAARDTSPQPQSYGARDASPQRYAGRDRSPEPYGRSLSPVPPVRSMEPQRGRSRSPQIEDRLTLPAEEVENPAEADRLGSFYRDPE